MRVRYLGRSAELTEIKKSIGSLSPDERKEVGRSSNLASREIEAALDSRIGEVSAREREERLREEAVDITLPGVPFQKGHLHPSLRIIDEVVDFFVGLGYRVAEGPEVETDYYNFTALGIPPGHPARTMQDTFFVDEGLVLRTQTSPDADQDACSRRSRRSTWCARAAPTGATRTRRTRRCSTRSRASRSTGACRSRT